jgi:hypothetical protein
MASTSTSTFLSNAVVTIASVDLTGQCSSATFTRNIEALESTNMSNTARTFVGGLENSSLVVDLYNSTAASSSYATLKTLVGTAVTVTVKSKDAATSATNPLHTLTGAYMGTLPLVVSSLGALDVMGGVTFQGGVYSVATA